MYERNEFPSQSGVDQATGINDPTRNSEISGWKGKGELKKDILCAIALAVTLFISLYFFLGYAKNGLDAPYSYSGDGISYLSRLKLIKEEGWFWFNGNVGAPFGAANLDFPADFFTSTELLITKLIGIFTDNVVVISNIQLLLTFSLCSLTAFFTLRYLSVGRYFSLYGAGLFGLAPYIFARNINHYSLAACYFVPFSVILCVWAFQEENDYLLLNRDFFKRRENWITVLFAFLIANNGIGYYAVFTCFFLCVVGFYKFCITKKISSLKKPVIIIGMILGFFLLALIPVFVYQIKNGSNLAMTQRNIASGEVYGLKIAQLFIPTNGHNISFLSQLITAYNSNMPLVNENASAYLGVGGIIGFLISLILLFIPSQIEESTEQKQLQLFSKLNVSAVLFATIGGFSSLFSLVVHFIRGYNRISIFILFISICVLTLVIQRVWKDGALNRRVFGAFLFILVGICVFDQMPTYGMNDAILAANKMEYQSDDHFIKAIEAQLEIGDMVYQLPYHKYPEVGPVLNMSDYQHFTGYLHAPSLKWSYGGVKGREADQWNESVAVLPFYNWLDTIIEAGFRGIYIDTRAYTPEDLAQLQENIEIATKAEPMISENGNLIFYNLYPYITDHTNHVAKQYQLGTVVAFDGSLNDAHRYFSEGMSGTEVDFAWTDGNHAKLELQILDDIEGSLVLRIDIPRIFNNVQRMTALCGESVLFDQAFEAGVSWIEIPIPAEYVQNKMLTIDFQFPDAISPKDLGQSGDARNLAFGISAFSLRYADTALMVNKYKLGTQVSFDGTDNDAHRYFVEGMSGTETDFAWTDGNYVKLQLRISDEITRDLTLKMDASRVFNDSQRMIVSCGDTILFDESIESGVGLIYIPIPVECVSERLLELDFQFPDAISPKNLGISEDARNLALGLASFSIDVQNEEKP